MQDAGRRRQAHVAKLAHRLYMKNMLAPKRLLSRAGDRLKVACGAGGARRILRAPGLSRMASVTGLAGAAGATEVKGVGARGEPCGGGEVRQPDPRRGVRRRGR